jgi:hypothetical protein
MRSLTRWLGGAAVSAAALLAPGCGGGGGGGGGGFGDPGEPSATSLAPMPAYAQDDVMHLLNRTRFGPTLADRSAVLSVGVGPFVDSMLQIQRNTVQEMQFTFEGFEDQAFPQEHELVRWWLRLMQENPNPFQEVLALFWHDHFATSQEILGGDKKGWWLSHLNLFRHQGAGNLRTLLTSVAQDWTMLEWLDGVRSSRNNPNENFAREFWELFTLGVDNGYTQADIVQAARCFTGYRTRYDDATGLSRVEFDANRHDTGNKDLLGERIQGRTGANGALEYSDMVNLTLAERPVAEFICKRLFEYFCYPNPPDEVIADLAGLLRQSGYELTPVLARLLKSEAFYSDMSKAGLVKSPVEHALGFVRATGMKTHLDDLDEGVTAGGQRPTMPPNVNGWPGGTLWLSAQGMVERANYVRDCLTHRGTDAQPGLNLVGLLPSGTSTTAPDAVDALSTLLRVTLAPGDREVLVTYLDTQRQGDGTVVDSPFDAANTRHVEERIGGLLYVLSQHPTYHVR